MTTVGSLFKWANRVHANIQLLCSLYFKFPYKLTLSLKVVGESICYTGYILQNIWHIRLSTLDRLHPDYIFTSRQGLDLPCNIAEFV